jgi:alkanesulfonate monooxygenase SsuD/methylene tetrahydromethanopterin reductase-like flavin-dependent oxidoreductase (luciferase family)
MMHLGISLSPFGHHPAAWRQPGATPRALDFGHLAAQVQKAEDGALDFVLLGDAHTRRPRIDLPAQTTPFEPTTLVAALATRVRKIGFVVTAASGQHELYNLARRFASLDLISQGRIGWSLVASGPTAAWNKEYVAVVAALWDSWDTDAFVYDKSSGRVFEPNKMRVLDHRGEHFTVRGPLNVNPSPQGTPLIAQALTAETLALVAHSTELLLVANASQEAGRSMVIEARQLLTDHGRDPSEVRSLANVVPWIGATRAEARSRFDQINELSSQESLEWRQGLDVIGTATDIADALQESFERGEFDGFIVMPPIAPGDLNAFVDCVVPELRRRGLFRAHYEGATLRDHLSLKPAQLPAK